MREVNLSFKNLFKLALKIFTDIFNKNKESSLVGWIQKRIAVDKILKMERRTLINVFALDLLIVLVSKVYRILLFFSIVFICFNPILDLSSQTLLPLEIRITELSYPPIVTIGEEDDPVNSYVRYGLDVRYELENPNDETVTVWMGMCYSLPFCHINATFEDSELKILYGYFGLAMICSQSFEPGLKTNQSTRINFQIDSYKEEELPFGFYTIWIDVDYDNVYYPTIVSHAFMNVTEEEVEIKIEWRDKTDYYTREVGLISDFMIFPLVIVSVVIVLRRNRISKKYFIY